MIEPKDLTITSVNLLTRPWICKTDFSLNIDWSTSNIGFGQAVLYSCDGKLGIETEHMTKEFVMELFSKLYDEAIKDSEQS